MECQPAPAAVPPACRAKHWSKAQRRAILPCALYMDPILTSNPATEADDRREAVTAPTARTTAAIRMWGTQGFLLLALMAPLLLVQWQQSDVAPVNILLAALVLLISSVRLAQALGPANLRMLTVTFYVFVYCFLGLATLAQVATRTYPTDALRYEDALVTHSLAVILVGVLAYEVGSRLGEVVAPGAARPKPRGEPVVVFSRTRVVVLGTFGLLMVAYVVAQSGLAPFFESRDAAGSALVGAPEGVKRYAVEDKTTNILRAAAVRVPVFISLYGMLIMIRNKQWQVRTPIGDLFTRAFLMALIAGNLVVNNPLGNGRAWFGTLVVALLSVFISYWRPKGIRVLAAGALIVLLFAFTSLDAFRRTGPAQIDTSGPGTALVSDASYSAFQTNLNGVAFVQNEGHTSGRQLLTAVFAFVPRSMWEGKGTDTGSLIDPRYNRSATFWTESYVDFGIPGVLVLFAAYGWGSVRLERRFAEGSAATAAFVPLVAGLQIFFLRGSLLPVAGIFYPLAICFLFVLARQRAKENQPKFLAHRD
jgi:hypothetical protein